MKKTLFPKTHNLTDGALEMVASRFRVLGEPMRLKILRELQHGERNVTTLIEATGATQANVSRHLSVLFHAGIVTRKRDGLNVLYRIQDPGVFQLCEIVCGDLEKHLHLQVKSIGQRS